MDKYIYKYIFDLQIEHTKFIHNSDIKEIYKYYIIDLLYLLNKKYNLFYLSPPLYSCGAARIYCNINTTYSLEIIYDTDTYYLHYYVSNITFYNIINNIMYRDLLHYNAIKKDKYDARILYYKIINLIN